MKSMKKIFETRLTDVNSTDKEGAGVLRFEGNKVYKYVKYNNGTDNITAVANKVVVYHGDDGYDDNEVTPDFSDGASVCAGTLVDVPADADFCWIQIQGDVILELSLTGGADGNSVTALGAGDGTLDVSALVTDHIAGVIIDVSLKKVLLDCPF